MEYPYDEANFPAVELGDVVSSNSGRGEIIDTPVAQIGGSWHEATPSPGRLHVGKCFYGWFM